MVHLSLARHGYQDKFAIELFEAKISLQHGIDLLIGQQAKASDIRVEHWRRVVAWNEQHVGVPNGLGVSPRASSVVPRASYVVFRCLMVRA